MTSQNNLEIRGSLRFNPFAELLAETFGAGLSGSYRLSNGDHKLAVYLRNGKPVFAASNARQHRLFEFLLKNDRITKEKLLQIPNFTKDLELAEALKSEGLFSNAENEEMFSLQIEEILKTAFDWNEGEWIFTPLARVKEEIQFQVDLQKLLLEYARALPANTIVKRFRSFQETFGANPSLISNLDLLPQEAFVLSRFEKTFLKIGDVKLLSGLPDAVTLQTLYVLWLSGFLFRQNWQPAFTERKLSEISSARLALKKEVLPTEEETVADTRKAPQFVPTPLPPPVQVASPPVETPQELSVEAYLTRLEEAESYYEVLDISADADVSDIKRSYFTFAKRFHPDRFYKETDAALVQRIQNAFAQLAQAYETLKSEDTRKTYDYRLTKHLAALRAKEQSENLTPEVKNEKTEMAKDAFDQGFSLLMEEELEEAIPFLARAVQMSPEIARYHAYYGKALSMDESQRYKAESELYAAIKIEPENATFRILLAEFYIQFELFRRAEGELQRLLAAFPDNKEAKLLLDSLRNK